ncbi:MAG: GNAT family N-acetyltransferase [Sedimentisphaerales bacterium]
MNYRIFEECDYPRWDEFVDLSPQGGIYSKSFYLKSVGYPFKIGVVEENGKVIGGIVLAKNEVGVLSNPLFVKHLGVLYADDVEKSGKGRDLKYKIDREIISNMSGWKIWSYSFHPNFKNWLNFYWSRYKQTTRYTYQIDFSKTSDFRANYGEKVKSPLRAARKAELVVDDIDAAAFAEVNEKTYKGKGGRQPYSRKRLVNLLNQLSEQKCLCMKSAKDREGNIHSVAAIVYDRRSANLILNGTDPAYRQFGGNSMLIDFMIEFASKKCGIFDFEGSMHEQIEKFYRGFGGELVPYYLIYKANLPTLLYHCLLDTAKKWS